MQEEGIPADVVQKELDLYYRMNRSFDSGRVLNSMYTSPHSLAVRAHMQFIEANMGNPGLYPGTVEMEKGVVSMLKSLANAGEDVSGHLTDGGTESNITAMWIARNISGKKAVVFPASGHFSLRKAANILGMEVREVPLDERCTMDLSELEKVVDDSVALVIGVAGTTELGLVDPIKEMADIIGNRAYLHVDAAFGGFVLPFMKDLGYPVPDYDFSLGAVSSMTLDPHKMGFSTLPCGSLLHRMGGEESITTEAPYLTRTKQAGLLGTRASASVAAAYAVMKHLGRKGYRDIVKECLENTRYLVRRAAEIGVEPVVEPYMNIVSFKFDNLTVVREEMERFGWALSVSRNPPGLRIVVMPHVTKSLIDDFIADLKNVLAVVGAV